MLSRGFEFWINIISRCVSWLFTIEINHSPSITLGMFLIGCAFIGIVLYFILDSDFIPGFTYVKGFRTSSNSNDSNYQPRHAVGTAGKDYSTRESRHKY